MNIQDLYQIYINNPSISTDTRKIKCGDIFWAIKGENFNGNEFVKHALNLGAKYAVSDDTTNKRYNQVIFVKDSLKTLQELAHFHRQKLKIPILVITGTNGKTTTKELIASVLSQKYNIGYTQGNLNNHIGVPLTILGFNKNTEIGIVEAGANHPGEIKFLCTIAHPNYGIITNIGKAHLEGFGTYDNLIQTKAELYDAIDKNGRIFVNADNELLMNLSKNKTIVTYGVKENVFCRANFISANPYVKINPGNTIDTLIHSQLVGKYNFENILAAVCIGKYFDVSDPKIKYAIENYIPQNNRSQVIQKGNSFIILDAYNANPSSMNVSIDNFIEAERKNKIVILGDMFELGEFEEYEHEQIIQKLIHYKMTRQISEIFLAGEAFYKSYEKIKTKAEINAYKTTEELIHEIEEYKIKESWILIKGSRGMKMETVVEHLKII